MCGALTKRECVTYAFACMQRQSLCPRGTCRLGVHSPMRAGRWLALALALPGAARVAAELPRLSPIRAVWDVRVSEEYPSPEAPQRCGWETAAEVRLCDPGAVLASSPRRDERARVLGALRRFEADLGSKLFGEWGVVVGVAVLAEATAEPLPVFAAGLADAWGLAGANSALLVLQPAGGRACVAIAGGLYADAAADAWARSAAGRAALELQVAGHLRAGRLAGAVEVGLQGLAGAAGHAGWWPQDALESVRLMEQRVVHSWRSPYQTGEVWENACGGERCLELFLNDVRQLSDRFHSYYHEAMTLPALNLLGPSRARLSCVIHTVPIPKLVSRAFVEHTDEHGMKFV